MKKFVLVLLFLSVVSVAYAKPYKKVVVNNTYNTFNSFINEEENEYGLKVDAPNLVKVAEKWSVGVEGGKNLNQTGLEDGWFAYLKATFSGTLLDLTKGGE